MKNLARALLFVVPAVALAQGKPVALGPNNGAYGAWTAASYGAGSAKICYAFTTATQSDPVIPKRGAVMLTVTERQGAHDEVTLSAGYTYPANANVTLTIGPQKISFYTQAGDAFTTEGSAAVAAFKSQAAAEARSPAPHGHPVTDEFSLKGFSGAYGAITAACP